MSVRTLTEFTKADWDGFAGARTSLRDEVPLIGFESAEGVQYIVIVDAQGIEITATNEDNGAEVGRMALEIEENVPLCRLIAENLPTIRDGATLLQYGFTDWTGGGIC